MKMNRARAYFGRGLAYYQIRDIYRVYSDRAYDDFVKADELDPSLKLRLVPAYIANQINNLSLDDEMKKELFRLFCDVFDEIDKIKVDRFLQYKDGQQIVHYTGLETMKKLLASSPSSFRFYNAAYMDDSKEGRTFFEIMKKKHCINIRRMFPINGGNSRVALACVATFCRRMFTRNWVNSRDRSPAYTGSFALARHGKKSISLEKLRRQLLWSAFDFQT